ncbi:MAG: PASTA domain-containing protein [Actinobacteria bacterium]|nr:PASTA domain-containing protein [Actinomycetota bacterium]
MTATSFEPGPQPVLDDRYRLLAEAGTGATARVVLADDLRLHRRVAVKILLPSLVTDPGFLARFEHEARSAATFSHPHVVAVYDWGDTGEGPYLVTEFLAGGSLHAMLAAGHTLSPSQVVKVGLEAASGLAAAHRRDLVHRDVKPATLLFDEGGRLRIADFGLVQALNSSSLTDPNGLVLGTWRYAAPERSRPGPVDGRSDVYSLAVALVEAFTGVTPGRDVDDPVELLAYRAVVDLEVPSGLGAASAILSRAGSADPALRPTADELMRGLVTATESLGLPERLPLAGAVAFEPVAADLTLAATDATDLLPAQQTQGSVQPGQTGEEVPLVLGSEPAARSTAPPTSKWRALWLLGAALVLAAAVAGSSYFVSTTEPTPVPVVALGDLRGSDIESVRSLANENGWLLDEVQVRSDDHERGAVIRQSPTPQSQLVSGAAVIVDVVTGPRRTMVPWVVGLTADGAADRLEARKFSVVTREPRFDEVVPAGVVIEATIDGGPITAGRLIEPGTAFELVVSEGPIPRQTPTLVGLTIENAQLTVDSVGLRLVQLETEFSETVVAGTIVSQTVAPGSQVARGSEVSVVASKGPDIRVVPNVEGLTIAEATAALERVGLVRSGVAGGGDIVTSSSPEPGAELREGDAVELWAP